MKNKNKIIGKMISLLVFLILVAPLSFVALNVLAGKKETDEDSENTIYVDAEKGDDKNGNGSSEKPYDRTQDAIDDAETKDGHTIMVYPDTYTENVDVTIVQTGNPNDHVFDVPKDATTIQGFTIKDATGYGRAGIYIGGSTVKNCRVEDNEIKDNYYGIYLDGTADCMVYTNMIHDNEKDGILIAGGAKKNIIEAGNIITHNKGNGITIKGNGTDENEVFANTIGTEESGNTAIPNEGNGILISGGAKKNVIHDSTISGNKKNGVVLLYSNKNEVKNNVITHNCRGIKEVGCTGNKIVRSNDSEPIKDW